MTGGAIVIDANTWRAASGASMCRVTWDQEISLTANTTYRLALTPDTANNVVLYYFDVDAANHMQALDGGTSFAITSRVDAGAWAAPTATRRPWMGIRISAVSDGVGGGGGGGGVRGIIGA
jgi:hypothetical protein